MSDRVYDLSKHLLMIGVVPISPNSIVKDGEITFKFDPMWGVERDAGGGLHVYKTGGTLQNGEVEIPIISGSPDNQALQALATLGIIGGTSSGGLVLADLNGLNLIAAPFCVVCPLEEFSLALKPTSNKWKVYFSSAAVNLGGKP